jgi:dynein heavy chain
MKPIVQDLGLPPTKTNLFSAYTKRVRSNLHTVITMSPLGEIFRARLRQFPAFLIILYALYLNNFQASEKLILVN